MIAWGHFVDQACGSGRNLRKMQLPSSGLEQTHENVQEGLVNFGKNGHHSLVLSRTFLVFLFFWPVFDYRKNYFDMNFFTV